jgi:hypothetical protein
MPCVDGRETNDRQLTIRVACELSKLVRALDEHGRRNLFSTLSSETKAWIEDHEKWDREFPEGSKHSG